MYVESFPLSKGALLDFLDILIHKEDNGARNQIIAQKTGKKIKRCKNWNFEKFEKFLKFENCSEEWDLAENRINF